MCAKVNDNLIVCGKPECRVQFAPSFPLLGGEGAFVGEFISRTNAGEGVLQQSFHDYTPPHHIPLLIGEEDIPTLQPTESEVLPC